MSILSEITLRPADPLVPGAISALFAAMAVLACGHTVRRATRADPLEPLRAEQAPMLLAPRSLVRLRRARHSGAVRSPGSLTPGL